MQVDIAKIYQFKDVEWTLSALFQLKKAGRFDIQIWRTGLYLCRSAQLVPISASSLQRTQQGRRIANSLGSAKISAVRSLADICFLHVLIWLITCIILSVCVSVFLVLSILHTVIYVSCSFVVVLRVGERLTTHSLISFYCFQFRKFVFYRLLFGFCSRLFLHFKDQSSP